MSQNVYPSVWCVFELMQRHVSAKVTQPKCKKNQSSNPSTTNSPNSSIYSLSVKLMSNARCIGENIHLYESF